MRQFVSALMLLSLLLFAGPVSFAGSKTEPQKKKVPPGSELESPYAVPEVRGGSNATLSVMDPGLGDPIGTTDYDYGWNSGSRQMVEAYFPGATAGTRAQFTFMKRNTLLPAPNNRRAQSYVYYNGTTYTPAVATIPVATRATGFGDISVFRSTIAAGIAAVTSHTPPALALNSIPGDTSFTFSDIPLPRPSSGSPGDPVSAIRGNSDTLYVVTSGGNRDDYWVFRSTDFGGSWTFLDSLMKYTPRTGLVSGTIDVPLQVLPNGDIYIFTTLTGAGSVPPLGTVGALDSADQIGYFKSTNGGTAWTWTRIGVDGQAMDPTQPNEYFLPENFGQLDGIVDATGGIHIAFNGYAIYQSAPDTLTVRKLMYWNSITSTFKNISQSTNTRDTSSLLNLYSGNALGRCYPTIAYDPTSQRVFVAWAQPQYTGAIPDTANGVLMYDIWWALSTNRGSTWSNATNLTSTPNATELFPSADRWLTPAGATPANRRAHLVYLSETKANAGCFVFSEGPVSQSPWIYRTIDFTPTSVNDEIGLPKVARLAQNFPNPFNPSTKIAFSIPNAANVKLAIYNSLGQQVATVVDEFKAAGNYQADFSAANLSSGVYFYTIRAGSFTDTKKMVLMK